MRTYKDFILTMNYVDFCIEKGKTIRNVMVLLGELSPKIVFVIEDKKLVASVTDGDIRRYLLGGGELTDDCFLASNINVISASDTSTAEQIFCQQELLAIPIINESEEVVDIYIGKHKNEQPVCKLAIPVVINAGGKGTRLEPYTKILPKPLIPVGEKPIIEQIMQRFDSVGCDSFSIIVNYKKEMIKAYFAGENDLYNISWYDERIPLGTGGGLCYLKGRIHETFIFTNCDNLLLADYEDIVRFHRNQENKITMICAYKNIQIPYGVIEMGENGSIIEMKEKPELSFLTNTGIYVVEPDVLDEIEDEIAIGFPDIVENIQKKGGKVSVYPVREDEWLDMGQLSELEKMRERLFGE